MRTLADALQAVALTLWVGGLWAVGYLVAPTLFASLSDRALAGMLAGRLFGGMAYVGLTCGAYLVLYRWGRHGAGAFRQAATWIVVLMLALTAGGHFGVQPILAGLKVQALPREALESVLQDRFAAWHGVASGLYLIQSLLGLALVVLQGRSSR